MKSVIFVLPLSKFIEIILYLFKKHLLNTSWVPRDKYDYFSWLFPSRSILTKPGIPHIKQSVYHGSTHFL